MNYATLADLQNKLDEATLVQLTDDADTGAVNATVIDAALEEAGAEIDGYLKKKGLLPLDTVPKRLVYMAADIAIVGLYSRKGGPPDHWQKRYEQHISDLKEIVAGDLAIGADAPDTSSANLQMTSSERIFSRGRMKGF